MEIKYITVQNTYHNGEATRVSFGIAAVTDYDGVTTVLESVADLSSQIEPIEYLVAKCNRGNLDPVHLQDVVTDFLATV